MAGNNPNSDTIPAGQSPGPAQDFTTLRAIGLEQIIQLGSNLWTDYNEHDPGITILEALAYAVTDLGYRTSFNIKDVLAQQQLSTAELAKTQFHTAAAILTSHPVTLDDIRKAIIDLPNVHNAWLVPYQAFQPIEGLYDIYLEIEPSVKTTLQQQQVIDDVQRAFVQMRNFGHDLHDIIPLQFTPVALDLNLVVDPGYKPEQVVASALLSLDNFLLGQLNFVTLQQILALNDGQVDKAFEGPRLLHGFVPNDELGAKMQSLTTRDISNQLRTVEGIFQVKKVQFLNQDTQQAQSITPLPNTIGSSGQQQAPQTDTIYFSPEQTPKIDELQNFSFNIFLGDVPYTLNMQLLEEEYRRQKNHQPASKLAAKHRDLPIPIGNYRNLEHYFSIQYDFPVIYGLQPGSVPSTASSKRKGEVKQLQGYLLLFDQVMADYLAQLANIGQLFSWDPTISRTYFFMGLEKAVQQLNTLLTGFPVPAPSALPNSPATIDPKQMAKALEAYKAQLAALREDPKTFRERRERFLDHVLARLGRTLTEYLANLEKEASTLQTSYTIQTQQYLLDQYPKLSRQRGKGQDYLANRFYGDALSGPRRLVEALFGMPPETRENYQFNQRFDLSYVADPHDTGAPEGQYSFIVADGTPMNMPFLMSIALDPNNYYIVQNSDGTMTLWLFEMGNTDGLGRIFYSLTTFLTIEAAEKAVPDIVALFQHYDQTSERLYLMDHVLLRPDASESQFGLEVMGNDGETMMSTSKWYSQNALAFILQLQGGGHPNFTINMDAAFHEMATGTPPFNFTISTYKNGQQVSGSNLEKVKKSLQLKENGDFPDQGMLKDWFRTFVQQNFDGYSDWALGKAMIQHFLSGPDPHYTGFPDLEFDLADLGRTFYGDFLQLIYGNVSNLQLGEAVVADLAQDPTTDWTNLYLIKVMKAFLKFVRNHYPTLLFQPFALGNALYEEFLSPLIYQYGTDTIGIADLSATGHNLAMVWLEQQYPDSLKTPKLLGFALIRDLDLGPTDPTAQEKTLEDLTYAQLNLFIAANVKEVNDPKIGHVNALLDAFLNPAQDQVLTTPANQRILASIGQSLMHQYLLFDWSIAPIAPLELGNYLIHLVKGSDPAESKSPVDMTMFVKYQLIHYLANQYPDLLQQPAALGKSILADLFSTDAGTILKDPNKQSRMAYAAQQSITYYLQRYFSEAGELVFPDGLQVLDNFQRQQDDLRNDPFFYPDSLGFLYYMQLNYPTLLDNPEALGQALIKDIVQQKELTYKSDSLYLQALAGAGGFLLCNYIENWLLYKSGQDLGEALQGLIERNLGTGGFVPWPSGYEPIVPTGTGSSTGDTTGTSPTGFYPTGTGGSTGDATGIPYTGFYPTGTGSSTGWHPITPAYHTIQVHQLSDKINLGAATEDAVVDYLLQHYSDEVVHEADKLQKAVEADILHPVLTSTLPAQSLLDLAETGISILQQFVMVQYPWQVNDPLALGTAVIAEYFPHGPKPSNVSPSTPIVPYTYKVQLEYFFNNQLIQFDPGQDYASTALAIEAIEQLCQSISKVNASEMAWTDLFTSKIKPYQIMGYPPEEYPVLKDPFTFVATAILPDWPNRFQDAGFKTLIERSLQEESPAYMMLQVVWMSMEELRAFDKEYALWRLISDDKRAQWVASQNLLDMIFSKLYPVQDQFTVGAQDPDNGYETGS